MPHRQLFPGVENLPTLSIADAERVLAALRALVAAELVDVYPVAGSLPTRWYVWRETTQERVPLPEWANAWLAHHPPTTDGEAADDD